jgi:hypothetical protein
MNSTTDRAMNQASAAVRRLNPQLFRLAGNNGAFLKPDAPSAATGAGMGIVAKPQKPQMNKTEARFLGFLQGMLRDGHCTFVSEHDALTLKLAEGRCQYTPDFWSKGRDGTWTAWEVKGFWRDDARVKIKVAASKWRALATFIAVQWKQGKWNFEQIEA